MRTDRRAGCRRSGARRTAALTAAALTAALTAALGAIIRAAPRAALAAAGAAIVTAVVPGQAAALEVGGGGGFVAGLLHPVLGFDHLLAMLAVGLLSVQMGGRAIWTVPAAFVVFLAIGGAAGLAGARLPQVEGMIALSVLALGLAIALRTRMPAIAGMALVGAFAIFHGYAHGAEIPRLAEPAAYVAGFVLASIGLHLTGVTIGLVGRRPQFRALLGAGVAGVGLHMVLLTYSIV